jgi:hypothetical protein
MKTLSLILIALSLSACGASAPSATQLEAAPNGVISPVNPIVPALPVVGCSLPIVGTFLNQGDGMQMTIAERNGECGIVLGCGYTGFVYDDGAGSYLMVADLVNGDSVGTCGFPHNTATLNGHQGVVIPLSFGYAAGLGQWLGAATTNEINSSNGNLWSEQ